MHMLNYMQTHARMHVRVHVGARTHTHTHYLTQPGGTGLEQKNKIDSLSVREKVRSSSASKKSFQIEGIKHFLFTSCSLFPSPSSFIHSLFLSLNASLTYKSFHFSPYCANFPFPAPVRMLWAAVAQTHS